MDARSISLHSLGENSIQKLVVPFFQRHYIWKKENWEKLYYDFTTPEIKPFLGSIILKEVSTNDGVAEMNIVDGQQRLTTISVLAKAIFDSLPEAVKLDRDCGIRRDVQGILYYQKNAADNFRDSRIKIEHSRADAGAYTRIMRTEMLDEETKIELEKIDEGSSLIEQCYKFFREKLAGKTVEELTALYNEVFDKNRRVLVMIKLQYGDINEQTIFDTINRAGVKLSIADIIKNNLFKMCLDKAGDSEERKKAVVCKYEDVWEELFYKKQENVKLWEQERTLYDVKRNNIEFLLYCVAQIHWGEEENLSSNLEAIYEKRLKSYGYKEVMDFITEICEYGEILKQFVLEFHQGVKEENISFRFKDHVTRLFLILDKFDLPVFYPYVLMRLREAKLDIYDEKLIEDFRILETFIVRRKISPIPGLDYTKKCRLLMKKGAKVLIGTELVSEESRLSDEDILPYLFSISDDAARLILFCIELYRCQDERKDITSLEYRYSLEHIMPQKWETHWGEIPVVKNGVILAPKSDEGIRFRDERVQALGNKTLLTFRLNASLQNETFQNKIESTDPVRPGYRSHTSLSITRELVDRFDQGNQTWNEQDIESRTNQFYKEFLEIWPSFKEKMADLESERNGSLAVVQTDPKLDKYSEEQLTDPFKLISAMEKEKKREEIGKSSPAD